VFFPHPQFSFFALVVVSFSLHNHPFEKRTVIRESFGMKHNQRERERERGKKMFFCSARRRILFLDKKINCF